ncbi:MAG: hypothetical protein WC987_08405, partial [Mariniphaga sp.]
PDYVCMSGSVGNNSNPAQQHRIFSEGKPECMQQLIAHVVCHRRAGHPLFLRLLLGIVTY